MAQFASLALIALSFIPLLSPFSYTAYNTQVGIFDHYYVRPVVHQWFEARYSPMVAILLLGLRCWSCSAPRTSRSTPWRGRSSASERVFLDLGCSG